MISRLEELGDLVGLALEVDALERRVRRVPAAVRYDEGEPLCEWSLGVPRLPACADAAVDEIEARTLADRLGVELGQALTREAIRDEPRTVDCDRCRNDTDSVLSRELRALPNIHRHD